MHNKGQNHKRIHFGLGKYDKIDKITINWPRGTIQEIKNVPVDRLIRIEEPY